MQRQHRGVAIEKKTVTDLSGGLNDTLVANYLNDNEGQVASNVFVNMRGGVEKRYGYVTDPSVATQSSSQFARLMAFKYTATTADQILAAVNQDVYIPTITNFQTGGSNTFPTYSNGTATFTNSSTTVTLSTGTQEWLTQIANQDMISVDSGTTWYTVSSITNDTTIVLTASFALSTVTGAYIVRQRIRTNLPVRGEMYNGSIFYGPAAYKAGGPLANGCIVYYDPTNGSKRIAPPSGAPAAWSPGIFAAFKNYLFAVDAGSVSTSIGSRLFWCALLNGTSWPSTNYIDVNPKDGQAIRGLIVHNDVLYIFKEQSIYYLIGNTFDPNNPQYSLNKVINPQNIGTYHQESIKVFKDKILFWHNDGIYALTGVNRVENISERKLRTTIRGLLVSPWPILTSNAEPAAAVWDNRYWLSVKTTASGTANGATICLEPNGSFTKHTFSAQNWVIGRTGLTGPGGYPLLGIQSNNWKFMQFDGTATNDDGAAITATWQSKDFSFNDFSRTTRVLDVYVAYYNTGNQAATLTITDDSGTVGSATAWTFPGAGSQTLTVQRFAVDRDTNIIEIKVSDNTAGSGFRLMGFTIVYEKDMAGSGVIVRT